MNNNYFSELLNDNSKNNNKCRNMKTNKNIKIKKNIKSKNNHKSKSKKNIPKKVREQIWLNNIGKQFDSKCFIDWCTNRIDVFNFHVGHDMPESKGGTLDFDNLKPICPNCNLSMSNKYTIEEWNNINNTSKNFFKILSKKFMYSSILLIPIIYYYYLMFKTKKK